MNNELESRIRDLSDKELIKYADNADDYTTEALAIAQDEIHRRGGLDKMRGDIARDNEEDKKQEGELSVKWLDFYTYIRIPLGILFSIISLFRASTMLANDPIALVFNLIFTVLGISLAMFLFIGLHRRRLWGWRLNWVVLVLEVVLVPLDSVDLTMYIIFLIAISLLWLLPNAIYFKKRRHLFT